MSKYENHGKTTAIRGPSDTAAAFHGPQPQPRLGELSHRRPAGPVIDRLSTSNETLRLRATTGSAGCRA
ncbi:hypothetical protein AB3M89_09310 [Microbacterium sp. 179-I 3D2 NHS]|uniref:hypothetical protein n=1 Tax=Microbacterium sp. 179-I 3D2 NHS TaxID=3235178 RepID=UPI0039A09DA5